MSGSKSTDAVVLSQWDNYNQAFGFKVSWGGGVGGGGEKNKWKYIYTVEIETFFNFLLAYRGIN